jgi:serine protease AprX
VIALASAILLTVGALPAWAETSSSSSSVSVSSSGTVSISSSVSGSGSATSTVTVNGTTTTVTARAGWNPTTGLGDVEANAYFGSLRSVRSQIGMAGTWGTGRGIDIALIDSGVVPVDGLDTRGRVINGPDLSFESQNTELRYLDTFGHGTHMAGIMVSDASDAPGIAPGARLVNIKVAPYNGAVDVTQILAAIDWVIQNRRSNGLNIRVLNLSYGIDSLNKADTDLLSYAVEQAWRAGIVVVAAAGNDGNGSRLTSPAYNPYVIAVGAADGSKLGTTENPIPGFSACGTGGRSPDVVAPGRSIASLRDPGSYADVKFPKARSEDGRLFIGSGTSQAAAVVSGAVAVLLEQRPSLTPDQVKRALTSTATPLSQAPGTCDGAGLVNVASASAMWGGSGAQSHPAATAAGSLHNSRGSHRVSLDGRELKGEVDIFGRPFDVAGWAARSRSGTAWSDGAWNGSKLTGTGFTANSWAGPAWAGVTWSGTSWSGTSWSGVTWSGVTWSGTTWSGTTWSGVSWSGVTWSDAAWQ